MDTAEHTAQPSELDFDCDDVPSENPGRIVDLGTSFEEGEWSLDIASGLDFAPNAARISEVHRSEGTGPAHRERNNAEVRVNPHPQWGSGEKSGQESNSRGSLKLQPRELARRRMQLAGMARRSLDAGAAEAEIRASQASQESQESDNSSDRPAIERQRSKKTTLGGFTIIRDDSDSDSSDMNMSNKDTMDEERIKDMDNMNALIDNEMSKVMANRQSNFAGSASYSLKPKLERALSDTLQDEHDEFVYKQVASTSTGRSSKAETRLSKIATAVAASTGRTSGKRQSGPRQSVGSIHEDVIRSMFAPGAGKHMKPYHSALARVVKHIFALDDVSIAIKSANPEDMQKQLLQRRSSLENLWEAVSSVRRSLGGKNVCKEVRRISNRIVTNSVFLAFFLFLTVYALFGPDMVALLGSKETDNLFIVLNTITFFLFIVELFLLIFGHKSYICTVPCALDFVAILSFIGDTALIGADEGITQSHLAQQTRMTRLTRISRVARVTRLVPRILAMFRSDKTDLARKILLRRLYRAFQFLDTDQDGFIASFDLKTFYLNVLQDCPQMFKSNRMEMLRLDSQILIGLNSKLEEEHSSTISYQDFCKTILSTNMGKAMVNFHLEDIDHARGMWTLTSKLSDSTALKVCIGILMLIILMNLLDLQSEDISSQQQLVHLHVLARNEHARDVINTTHLCASIDYYREEPRLLYLWLDGRTYVDMTAGSNACLPEGILAKDLDPFKRAKDIIKQTGLRSSELIQVCWPKSEACDIGVTTSMSILDNEKEVKVQLAWSTASTAAIIIIILVFIAFFNRGISKFSNTTLHPLRSLVDDMMAVSSLELINIDADVPVELVNGQWRTKRKKGPTEVEELQHLQKAFKSMRGAIRSWSRYVPPSVVQRLFSAGIEATIGVSRVQATILFVDVYDFEDACRGLSPSEVNSALGSVLGRIAMVIQNNRGTLLEFIGDEVLAVFNTPSMVRNHIYMAVASALEIHSKIAELPPISSEGRESPIRCRCGVHTAVILAGNIGSHRRMKYGLLGDGVNLSARLKGINSRYRTQTICSENVKADEYSARRAVFRPLDMVAVKGKTEPTMVYEIMGFAKGEDVNRARILKEASAKHFEAFRFYYEREFRRSKALFDDVALTLEELNHNTVQVCGRDEPARQLKRRCQGYIKKPPGSDWDGVERLTKKIFEMEEQDDDSSLEEMTVTSEAEAIKSRSTADLTAGSQVGSLVGEEGDSDRTAISKHVDAGEMEDSSSAEADRELFCPCSSFNSRSTRLCQEGGIAASCVRRV